MEAKSVDLEEQEGHSWSWNYVPRRRRILPGDAFFEDGNLENSLTHKQMTVEETDEADYHTRHQDFKCHVIGCNQTFTTIQSYEIHYNGAHRNICRYCRRSYPSNHLLDIHILESHDSLFEVLAQKQPMYQCLVESCPEKFPDSQTRREHLIRHHHYPADFRFQKGISKPRSHRTSQETTQDAMETETSTDGNGHTDADKSPATHGDTPQTTCVGHKTPAENRQHRVPANISFGRGGTRSFQRGHQKQQNKPKKHKGHTHKSRSHALKEEPMDELHVDHDANSNDRTEEEPMSVSNEYS